MLACTLRSTFISIFWSNNSSKQGWAVFCFVRVKDLEFMEKKIEDIEKSMKRSNDKQLKIELELCQRVCRVFVF